MNTCKYWSAAAYNFSEGSIFVGCSERSVLSLQCFIPMMKALIRLLKYILVIYISYEIVNRMSFENKAVFNYKVMWNNQVQNIKICSPKLYAKVQGIYHQIRDQFGNENVSQIFPYEYIIENKQICYDNQFIKAIDFILSSPQDSIIRQNIRTRWGNPQFIEHTGIKMVFLLGRSAYSRINKAVLHENREHQDIIQMNFQDDYNNLKLKTLSLLHWTKINCKTVDWIIKSDTDVLINIFLMPKYSS